ncbi:MFS transporter [Actinoplanes sp. NPDC051346]|uniref:MFS transporter n=1 Tax=Actinoplanes sp. NPDC051346 TaxID=3155048 RepID=UPI0034458D31
MRDRPAAAAEGPVGPTVPVRRVATTVVLLGIVSMLTDVSSEMVAAVLPLYLTAELGLGYVAYGFVDGAYQGVSALVRMLGGYASDRTGAAKWIAVVGYGVSAVSRLAMLPAQAFLAITAVVTADRLGKGLRTAPRDAMIAAASRPETLGRSFGVHRALDTLGAALGPLVAFGLLAAVPGSYDSVFVVSFAVAAVGVAVLVLFVPARRALPAARLRARGIMKELTSRRLRRPVVACALLGLVTVGDGFLYLSLQQRTDLDASLFPLLYVGTNAVYLLLAVPMGRLADRVGRGRVLIGGHVALLSVYLVAGGPVHTWTAVVVSLALLGTFYAATDGVLPAMVSPLVAPEARASGIAAAQTVVVVARFASSVAFGALWAAAGPGVGLVVFAVLLGAALPAAAWLLAGRGSGGTLDETRPAEVTA